MTIDMWMGAVSSDIDINFVVIGMIAWDTGQRRIVKIISFTFIYNGGRDIRYTGFSINIQPEVDTNLGQPRAEHLYQVNGTEGN